MMTGLERLPITVSRVGSSMRELGVKRTLAFIKCRKTSSQLALGAVWQSLRAVLMVLLTGAPTIAQHVVDSQSTAVTVATLISHTTGPTIWMGGSAGPDHDYPSLLNDYGPALSGAGVRVLKVYTSDLVYGSASEVRHIIAYCHANGLKLAAEGYLVSAFSPSEVSEGESRPGEIDKLVRRLRSMGGELDYFESDETLLRAHTFYKHPIGDIAANAARNAQLLRTAFPDIQIADIEPFPQNITELRAFLRDFARAAGHPFDIYNPDIAWNSEYGDTKWLEKLPDLSKLVKSLHMRLAVIYNGNDRKTKDSVEWVTLAERRIAAVESTHSINAADAIIQTWDKFPTKIGPATEPGTMLNMTTVYASLVRLYRSGYLARPATVRATITAPATIRPDSADRTSLSSIRILGPQQEIAARSRLAAVLMLDSGKFEGTGPAAVPSAVRTEKVRVLAGTMNEINDALGHLYVSGTMPRTVLDIEIFGATGNLGRKTVTIARE